MDFWLIVIWLRKLRERNLGFVTKNVHKQKKWSAEETTAGSSFKLYDVTCVWEVDQLDQVGRGWQKSGP